MDQMHLKGPALLLLLFFLFLKELALRYCLSEVLLLGLPHHFLTTQGTPC